LNRGDTFGGDELNTRFLEFWGTFFLNAAKGQKQLEQMAEWFKKGFSMSDESAALFKKFYGPDASQDAAAVNSDAWQKAIRDFEESFNQFAGQFGWVSKSEHAALQQKCQELEKTVDQQVRTIDQLRVLLEIKQELAGGEIMDRFQSLVQEQSEQFQRLMATMGTAFTQGVKGKQ
jgi:hypothetical protein